MELLKEIAPRVTRVAVLRDLTIGPAQLSAIQAVAPSFGVELSAVGVGDVGEIERSVAAFARSSNAGLVVTSSTSALVHRDLITMLAARHRLPAVYPFRYFVTVGGLISYGANTTDPYRRAAGYVDRILKGEKPADLPVQAPTKYELVINLKTAKSLGLEIPPSLGAGSASDTTARLFAERLSARWGKPVVVENRPGGDGLVSLDAFVGAHDDHTMWFGPAGAFNVLPYQHDTLPFDLKRDLNPVVSVSQVVLAISMPASMNVNSIDQLVTMARAQPGKLNAAAANGISDFLLFGFIKSMGLQIVRVPYRDIMQAPNDLTESRIQILSTSLAVVQPLSQAGRIKVLAVTSRQRAPSAPDVPTAAEAGYPALTFESIGGVFGPQGMPKELRESIAADFQKVAEAPIIAKRLGDTGQIISVSGLPNSERACKSSVTSSPRSPGRSASNRRNRTVSRCGG